MKINDFFYEKFHQVLISRKHKLKKKHVKIEDKLYFKYQLLWCIYIKEQYYLFFKRTEILNCGKSKRKFIEQIKKITIIINTRCYGVFTLKIKDDSVF